MGSYLSSPVKEKESENGVIEKEGFTDYGASCMQGWRVSQEDAHVALPDFDEGAMLFAVFDGHGGAEVAKYAALHLGNHLKTMEKYKQGNYEEALVEGFLSFDALLREPHVLEVLKAISKSCESENGDDTVAVDGGSSDEEEEAEDLENLLDEADAPISEIMQRCGQGDVKALIQKRIDMGRLLRAAVAKMGGDEDSEESEEEDSEEDELDDTETSEEPPPEAEGAPSTKENDSHPLAQVNLTHLVQTDDSTGTESTVVTMKVDIVVETKEEPSQPTVSASSSIPARSVIIDDDAAGSSAGPSSSQASASSSGCSSDLPNGHALDAVDDLTDRDYEPADEIDSDDEEDDWEVDLEATARAKAKLTPGSRRRMLAPGMFEFGDMGQHSVVCGFDSGATACLGLIKNSTLYVANVGDSRCVVSQNGMAVEMSFDHKPEDAVETARINRAGGKVTADGRVNNGLNLSRALGDHNYKKNEALDLAEQMISGKPDIKKLDLNASHEFMVIACDGIWNSMSSQEVVDFIRTRLPHTPTGGLARICEQLFDAVLAPSAGGDGTGMDNTTCIIVRFAQPTTVTEEAKPVNGTAHPVPLPQVDASPPSNASQKRQHEDDENGPELLASLKKMKPSEECPILNGGSHV